MAKKTAKNLGTEKTGAKKPRKPGQVTGVGTPGTTSYAGKPGVSRGKKM